MRSSKSRSRSKTNRPRPLGNIVNRVFDSSGPEGKVRGTPQQIIDKYLVLAAVLRAVRRGAVAGIVAVLAVVAVIALLAARAGLVVAAKAVAAHLGLARGLALGLGQHARIVFGMLEEVLRGHTIVAQLRITREHQVLVDDLLRGSTHLALGAGAVEHAVDDIAQRARAVRFGTRAGLG